MHLRLNCLAGESPTIRRIVYETRHRSYPVAYVVRLGRLGRRAGNVTTHGEFNHYLQAGSGGRRAGDVTAPYQDHSRAPMGDLCLTKFSLENREQML